MHKVSKKALVMLLGDPSGDPRPNRIIGALSQHGYTVDVVSHEIKGNVNAHQQWTIKTNLSTKLLRKAFYLLRLTLSVFPGSTGIKNLVNNLAFGLTGLQRFFHDLNYTVIVVEDLFLLPIAFKIKKKAKIIFDAREYYPRQNEEKFIWRVFEKPERVRLCAQYLHLCDHILTVSPGLQREYKKDFGVDTILYRSVPRYSESKLRPTDPGDIKLVHHGVANPNRKLERMIEVMKRLDQRYTLDFILWAKKKYS